MSTQVISNLLFINSLFRRSKQYIFSLYLTLLVQGGYVTFGVRGLSEKMYVILDFQDFLMRS